MHFFSNTDLFVLPSDGNYKKDSALSRS